MRAILVVITLFLCNNLLAQTGTTANSNSEKGSVASFVEVKGLKQILYLDFEIMKALPTMDHYRKIEDKILKLPVELTRFIDSIDCNFIKKDSVIVTFYLQDYAYRSNNSITLVDRNEMGSDTLFMVYVKVDHKMKTTIENYETFNNRLFSYDVIKKPLGSRNNKYTRLILSKTYQFPRP